MCCILCNRHKCKRGPLSQVGPGPPTCFIRPCKLVKCSKNKITPALTLTSICMLKSVCGPNMYVIVSKMFPYAVVVIVRTNLIESLYGHRHREVGNSKQNCLVNPLIAGAAYIRVLFFLAHLVPPFKHIKNVTSISNIWKKLTSILSNLNNFHSLEVGYRVSETKLQVGEIQIE